MAPEVRHFDFEVPGCQELAFTPGPFISVLEKVDGKEITRPYSIASPRGGNQFALCLNRVPGRLLSSFTLRPGEELEMREPLGCFTLRRRPGGHAVFVATGTGIAPFRSMLLDHLPKTQPHITLLFGTRYEHGLLYREDMERLAREFKTFRFMPTLTHPGDCWKGRRGRVQVHLDEALSFRTSGQMVNTDVYVCGSKEMVGDVRQELKHRGVDHTRIVYEKYA